MKKPWLAVSDHALIRYLERVEGRDMEQLRREIGHRLDQAADGHEGLSAVVVDGLRYRIENRVVTTVLYASQRPHGASTERQHADADE